MFKRVFYVYFSLALSAIFASEDAIHFINVGQGHCTLIARQGRNSDGTPFFPLLIDAGSSYSPPQRHGLGYVWEPIPKEAIAASIANDIKNIWGRSNSELPFGTNPVWGLNIIITHGDEDHKNLFHDILNNLSAYIQAQPQNFFFLLGGNIEHYYTPRPKSQETPYNPFEWLQSIGVVFDLGGNRLPNALRAFSSDWPIYHSTESLATSPLAKSGCITDLFLPRGKAGGKDEDKNSWSIVTRIQLANPCGAPFPGTSALITGDAGASVQKWIVDQLMFKERLCSDIFLFPHHGAAALGKCRTLNRKFHYYVNPQTVVFSAGSAGAYRHPKGKALLEALAPSLSPRRHLEKTNRLWSASAEHHPILYHAKTNVHGEIVTAIRAQGRWISEPTAAATVPRGDWRLIWVNFPAYMLWVNGSLVFKNNAVNPEFRDTISRIMPYVAVPDPRDLLLPSDRVRLLYYTTRWIARIEHMLSRFADCEHKRLWDIINKAAVYADVEDILEPAHFEPEQDCIWGGLIAGVLSPFATDSRLETYVQQFFGPSVEPDCATED